jgi:hypothetical protein
VTAPDPLAALQETVAALSANLASHRGQIGALSRYAHGSHDELTAQLEELAATVTGALDAAAPRGPAAPRWDNLDADAYARQLAWLRQWVDKILIPCHVRGGPYTLPDCWAQHHHTLWELGLLAARWQQAFARTRPDLALALEFLDRWLPGAMRRVDDATRRCTPRHQPGWP